MSGSSASGPRYFQHDEVQRRAVIVPMLREFEQAGRNCEVDSVLAGWLADQLERLGELEARAADTPDSGYNIVIAEE